MKYDINRINIQLFTQQTRWLSGKEIEFHILWSKDQISQMTCVVVNIEILTKYSIPT